MGNLRYEENFGRGDNYARWKYWDTRTAWRPHCSSINKAFSIQFINQPTHPHMHYWGYLQWLSDLKLWDCCKIPISAFSLPNIVLTYTKVTSGNVGSNALTRCFATIPLFSVESPTQTGHVREPTDFISQNLNPEKLFAV